MTEPNAPRVADAPASHRYEISVGGELAGFTEYVDVEGQRVFYHTEVDEKFAGQGLAAVLVSQALGDTRSAGKRVVAVCPYIAKFVQRHHDFDDILEPVTPAAMAAVSSTKERAPD